MLSAQPAMERIYVPAEALALFAVPWWICALSQPLNGLAFGTDGIHWGARDFRYLRNAVFAAGAAGAAALLFVDIESPQALNRTWLAAAAWVGARAALGILRVWPGIRSGCAAQADSTGPRRRRGRGGPLSTMNSARVLRGAPGRVT